MKTFFTLVMSCASFLSFAAVLTVSNNPAIPAQYGTAQSAYDAATNGDILYLHGSITTYTLNFTTKKVRVIGPGFNPTGQNNLRASLDFNLYPATETALDNLSLEGVTIDSRCDIYSGPQTNLGAGFSVNNLQLSRCCYRGSYFVYNGSGSHSIQFVQSLISGVNFFTALPSGVSAFNCIITGHVQGFNNAFFRNCTFFVANDNSTYSCPLNSCVVENSIFKTNGNNFGGSNSVFLNCLFNGAQSQAGSNNNFQSCLFQTNPGFTDATTNVDLNFFGQDEITTFFNETDLRLSVGSAALTAGSGGTPAGVTGGNFGFSNPKLQGRTTLPQLNSLSLSTIAPAQNGTINVTFQAEKQD